MPRRKGTIEEMQAIARQRGGLCLSNTYLNSKTKLKWQCAYGHIWEATPRDVKHRGKWCPYDSGRKKWPEKNTQ